MVADPSADRRKGVVFAEQLQGFGVFAGIDQGDVALDADMGRAGGPAGGYAAFGDAVAAGYSLLITLEDGRARIEALVVFVGQFNGAYFGAIPTAGALV
jgi:hypothetical protein